MPHASNGSIRIYYEESGKGDEVIVLIPGLGLTTLAWSGVTRALSEDFRVIAVDPRGAGQSDKPDIEYTGRLNADDMVAVLDAAGVESAHIVGMSMGGMIGQELALNHPSRVRSLVLASTYAATDSWSQRLFEVRKQMILELGLLAQFKLSVMFVFSPYAFRRMENQVAAIENSLTTKPPDKNAYVRQMTYCMTHDTRDRLKQIRVPTVVATGHYDILTSPIQGRELAEGIPRAEYVEFPEASHGLIFEEVESFSKFVRDFVRRQART
jgi:pimeloyl-ACP methyl ester carboxylesterase